MSERRLSPRVLQVLEATLGGTRRYLENIFEALGPGAHNGLVYSLHRADSEFLTLLDRLRDAGWSLFELDMRREINPRNDFDCVRQMRAILRKFVPDVVHAHASKGGAIARLAAIGLRPRPGMVYSPHAIAVNMGWIYRPIEHLLATQLDILSAVTQSEREELRGLRLVPAGRVHVVVPSISPEAYAPMDQATARRQLGISAGPVVIAIGRLSPQKAPHSFVDFVAALQARIGHVRALWIGDGPLRESVTARIAALGLSDVISIAGWKPDVRPYIAASDLLVSTAIYESFGYVTAEAMAMCRPVVASAITGTVDVVTTDVADQLYNSNDVSAAVLLAERLLVDRGRASEVARRGRTSVLTKFSIEATRLGLSTAYGAAARR